jgi:DNA gyrase subunit A
VTDDLGRVRIVRIEDEMRTSYLDYAMSVIVARALPDVRDGLKPVHRRILYAMGEMGLSATSSYRKCAAIVGDVMGKYHPHGDAAIYDTLVRLAQDFSMRYPLVDGQGNFGSIDGDSAAAMRYTEARLTGIAAEMLADIDKNTVDFVENYDGTQKEPTVLPAKLPNLLVNGSSGIAVGMATNIPPHHLGEVCDAVRALIEDPELTSDDLCKYVLGPDFPTGGTMYRFETRRNPITGENETVDAIREMYAHGRGRVVVRAQVAFEETRNGRMSIIVTELPYQVNKAALLEKMAELVGAKKIEGISDLRDESDRDGMRIYVEIKRDADPHRVLNNLFKHTAMQTAFNANMLALVDGQPQTLSLKAILAHYIDYRRQVVRRRTEFDLEKARARAHILEGLKIALDNLDEVIRTIRGSADVETARNNLIARFGLTEIQSQAILDMRLARLAALERKKIEDEYLEVIQLIAELEEILANPSRISAVIKDELTALKAKYAGARRTKIADDSSREMTDEDLIADEDVVITISRRGYIKRQPVATYRRQGRGGKGIIGHVTREEDAVEHLLVANTHDWALFFTNRGRVFSAKVHTIVDASRRAGRSADGHHHLAGLQGRQVPGHGHPQRHRQEVPARAVRQGPLQRHHRHHHRPRRRTRLGRRCFGQGRCHRRHSPGQDRPLPRGGGPTDGPPGGRRDRHPAGQPYRPRRRHERCPAHRRSPRPDRNRLRQARPADRVPPHAPRQPGRAAHLARGQEDR